METADKRHFPNVSVWNKHARFVSAWCGHFVVLGCCADVVDAAESAPLTRNSRLAAFVEGFFHIDVITFGLFLDFWARCGFGFGSERRICQGPK